MSEELRVEYERSGGFAGLRLRAEADTASLPPEEAESLRRLVERADVSSLPERTGEPARGADRFEHTLTVVSGGQRRTIRLADGAVPGSLRPLLDYLLGRARRGGAGAS